MGFLDIEKKSSEISRNYKIIPQRSGLLRTSENSVEATDAQVQEIRLLYGNNKLQFHEKDTLARDNFK